MADLKSALVYPADLEKAYVEAGYWTEETPPHWLAGWAARRPDAPAGVGMGAPLTYGALYDQARRVAAGLLARGFRKGDAIALQLPNSPQFMTVFHGVQLMGGVACMLHMPYRAGELEAMLRHAGAKGVFCFGGLDTYDAAGTMLGLAKSVPSLETVVVVGGEAPAGALGLDELLSAEPADITDPPAAADPSIIAFTSGTSASPKAVVHAHRTLAASARATAADFGWTEDDVALCAPPFTHAFGAVVLLTILRVGAAAALMPLYTPPNLAETIKATRATSLCCGPAHILANAKAGLLGPGITDSIRSAFVGGAPCPPEAIQTMQDACPGGTIYQAWGMTEVLMGIINPLGAPLDLRLKTLGTAPVGHELRIVGPDGSVLGPGEEGEMEIRGPFLFAGYFDNEDANRAAFTLDGWYKTGDLAAIDRDGNVTMTGRAKDIINRGGIKINPVDIELLMDAHPAVLQAAIIPVPDEVLGERACLVAVLAPGQSLSLEAVQDYLASRRVIKERWPERLEVVDAMPMTPTRKIVKGKLIRQITGAG